MRSQNAPTTPDSLDEINQVFDNNLLIADMISAPKLREKTIAVVQKQRNDAIRLHYRQRVLAALLEKFNLMKAESPEEMTGFEWYNQAIDDFREALLGIFGEDK